MTLVRQAVIYLSALVLTEDSSSQAIETVKAFLRHLFLLVDPRTQTQHLDLQPITDAKARAMVIANRWKSKNSKDHAMKIALFRTIATKIREPCGFVFFHFDGDTPLGKAGVLSEGHGRAQLRAFRPLLISGDAIPPRQDLLKAVPSRR